MLSVGLTGGIASGKSTVARMLEEKGAFLIDFDVLTRKVEKPGTSTWKKIVDYFGEGILNEDQTINRNRLGSIVFHDREKLTRLNEIVHPDVFREWHILLSDLNENYPDKIIISDIPLLIETGVQKKFDMIVLVYAPPRQQVERLTKKLKCNPEEALQRLASQMPIDEKIAQADIVIDNSGSLDKTKKSVDDLWIELVRREKHNRTILSNS